MMGETAFRAGETEKARDAFTRLRETYPQYEHTPDGVEGLGYIEEGAKAHDEALKLYREVQEKWPNSFTARRQPFNIGRALEAKEDLAGAVAAYREQLTTFPASVVARHAQSAIDILRANHPELFPEEAAKPAAEVPVTETSPSDAIPKLKLELHRDKAGETPTADSDAPSEAATAIESDVTPPAAETEAAPESGNPAAPPQ
jgi:tetratricopeptide (TPR) repeat protein